MNILVYGNGTLSVGQQEQKICQAIAKLGHRVYLLCNTQKKMFDVGVIPTHPNLTVIDEPNNGYDPSMIENVGKIDACLGMDQSVAPIVAAFKEQHQNVYTACMFLDYPVHVVDESESINYNFEYAQRYYYWMSCALELDTIIFNNTVAVDRFKKKFKRDSKLVWYCVTEDNFLSSFTPDKQEYVVACNRLIPYKGTDYLVDALARTDYKYSHIAVSGNLKDRFLARCANSMPGRVEFLERCNENKKMEVIANAKVFVYPQITEWVGGLGVLEAMSVRTPAICFDYPVLRELYGDSVLYAIKRSPRDLRNKINELWNDEELYKDLQDRGQARFKKYFTKETMAHNLVEALKC